MEEGRAAEGAPQLVPWEMTEEEILSLGEPLASELMKIKKDYEAGQTEPESETIDDYISKLEKAGFSGLDSIGSAEEALNLALNKVSELTSSVSLLRSTLNEKEKNEKERQEAEKDYIRKLEKDVSEHFGVLLHIPKNSERRNTIGVFNDFLLKPFESKFLGEGYTVTPERGGAFSISFENIEAAVWFAGKFNELRAQQYQDVLERCHNLEAVEKGLRKQLKDEGKDGSFQTDIARELARTKKELLEKIAKSDELYHMPQEKLVSNYMDLVDQLIMMEGQLSIFEELVPESKDKSGAEKWNYITGQIREIQDKAKDLSRDLQREQQRYSLAEKGLNEQIKKNSQIKRLANTFTARVGQKSKQMLGLLSSIADYLKGNNIVYDFGHEVGEKKPFEYLSLVSSEMEKLGEVVKSLTEGNKNLRQENKELYSENKFLKEFAQKAVDGARELREKLDEFKASPEETRQRNSLAKRVLRVQHGFIRYLEASRNGEDYAGIRTEVRNVSFENMVAEHYLKILDEGILLVESEFSGLEQAMRVGREREEMAAQYNCGSFDDLKSRYGSAKTKIEELKEKESRFEESFEDFRKTYGIKPKTVATVKKHIVALLQADYLGEESQQEILNKLCSGECSEEELRKSADILFDEYEAILDLKFDLAEEAYNLDSEFDLNYADRRESSSGEELRDYLSRSKTVEKAMDFFGEVGSDMKKGILEAIKTRSGMNQAENFSALVDLGNVFGRKIDSPGDLLEALKEERDVFSSYIESYKQEKGKLLDRLNQ